MYQSLYRKYRPKTLTDVVGQDIAVKILKNSLNNNKINHAYLFSGPRGTGKTTMAKIYAKLVNCLDLKDGIACEKCKNCIEINNSTMDVIEIDAASNNGVDEIREIRNNVSLSCSTLNYKIYIIDEVHMLTIGAFNALLKTLEEPPEHIIFILATTDIQKVPTTIISRCQCINFESISEKNIMNRLKYIASEEKVKIDDEVLLKISEISNGGLRDAIGNLEKLVAAAENNIDIKKFNEVFGFVDDLELVEFYNSLLDANIDNILSISQKIYENGKNYVIFTNELIEYIRKQLKEYYSTNNNKTILCDLIIELNKLCSDLKSTDSIKALFEANIIKFVITKIKNTNELIDSLVENNIPTTNRKQNIIQDEIKENNIDDKNNENLNDDNIIVRNNSIILNNVFALANKSDLIDIKEKWKKLNDYLLDKKIGSIACFLADGNIRACGKNNLIISYEYDAMVNKGLETYDELIATLNNLFNEKYNISFITDDNWNQEKKKYIENKQKNKKYELKELEKETKQIQKKEIDKASDLFGEDIVEIR